MELTFTTMHAEDRAEADARWKEAGIEPPDMLRDDAHHLNAIVGFEPLGRPGAEKRWHISLSHDDRLPTWEETVAAVHVLRPGVPFALGIPPRSWWLNFHPHVQHIWEIRDADLIEQWRFERQGHTPT